MAGRDKPNRNNSVETDRQDQGDTVGPMADTPVMNDVASQILDRLDSIEGRFDRIESRISKIESRVNPLDRPVTLPEKKNYNPDYLPHDVPGVKGLDELPPKTS